LAVELNRSQLLREPDKIIICPIALSLAISPSVDGLGQGSFDPSYTKLPCASRDYS
jgi:hypothetical protein